MSARKRALGRGLDALMSPDDTPNPSSDGRKVVEIPLGELRANSNQPRSLFDEEHITELASSIREKGILQPILVRRHLDAYQIIAGERRYRAAQSLNLEKAPCLVVEVSDRESFVIALIENIQREDLNAIEEAKAYQALIDQFDLSQEEVATRVGKSRSAVANSLRLMNLPLDIQDDILEGTMSAGHARAILQLTDLPKQRQLRNLIIGKGLSVREAESRAREMAKPHKKRPPKPKSVDVQMRSIQDEMTMKIGVPVFIRPITTESGKIEIQYQSLDDFDQIADFFGMAKQ